MDTDQDKVFAESEGDRWFQRNFGSASEHASLFDAAADLPLRVLDLYNLRPASVIEVGASCGYRLSAIQKSWGARCVAVEPSAEAVAFGRQRFRNIEFVQSVAAHVPVDGPFDLVIVHFVFHWVGRPTLMRSLAEVDRLVDDGGHLLIGDFLPSNPTRVPYHHIPDSAVYTYKQDYATPFLASGLYRPVAMLTADHATGAFRADVPEHDRAVVWLLQKQLTAGYAEGSFSPGGTE